MAYAAYTDVELLISELLNLTLSEATVPTTTTVDTWCDQLSAVVNSALTRAGYGTIPASGTNDLALLKFWVAGRAAGIIWEQKFGGSSETMPESIRKQWEGFDGFVEGLANASVWLVDQKPTRGSTKVTAAVRADAYAADDTY
jgi:hypothetical protein